VIAGLEAGADDYVRKPVDASELTARIRALLRRARGGVPGPNTRAHLELDDLRVYPGRSEAFLDGTLVRVTKTEFRLLCELLWAGGRPVSREELLQRVWGYGYFGDTRLLDVHIRRLRLKVETDPSQPKLIITVRGVGYRAGYAPAA
jgi:two-component system response regulator MtrA